MNSAENLYPVTEQQLADLAQGHWDDKHLIAYIEVWAQPPAGWPQRHPLYYLDESKGWFYLTPQGEREYREQKAAIDVLKALQGERLAAQLSIGIGIMLGRTQEKGQEQ